MTVLRSGRLSALIAIAVMAAPALMLASPASAAEKLRVVITETVTPPVPNSVQSLAKTMGYYDKAGVDVEIVRVQQTPSAIAALTSGEADMANVSFDAAAQLVARGLLKIKAVTSPDKAIPFMIASSDKLKTAKDIEGRTFGVSRIGSLDHSLSMTVLKNMGVNTDKIDIVNVGEPAVRAVALVSGKVDSTSMSIGTWSSIKDRPANIRILVTQPDYFNAAPTLSKVNIVKEDVAKSKSAAIAAFVKGIMLASRDFHNNPALWVEGMSKDRTDMDRATLVDLSQAYVNSWSANGGLNMKAVAYTTDEVYKGPDFKDLRKVAPAEWIDLSFADAALKDLGKAAGIDDPGR